MPNYCFKGIVVKIPRVIAVEFKVQLSVYHSAHLLDLHA